MKLDMAAHMLEWFWAEVMVDGEIVYTTSSRDDLIDWANQHMDLAHATFYANYQMADDTRDGEEVGPLADLITWPDPEPVEPDWAALEENAYGYQAGHSTPLVEPISF